MVDRQNFHRIVIAARRGVPGGHFNAADLRALRKRAETLGLHPDVAEAVIATSAPPRLTPAQRLAFRLEIAAHA